jgi:hypothetical protein
LKGLRLKEGVSPTKSQINAHSASKGVIFINKVVKPTGSLVDEDDTPRLEDFIIKLKSDDWEHRFTAISDATDWIMKQKEVDKFKMRGIFDQFAQRCNDGNSKVAIRALNCLQEIMPLIGSDIESVLPFLIPVLANQLISLNPTLRNSSGRAFDLCLKHCDPGTLFQILTGIAQFGGNFKLKSATIEKLAGNYYNSKNKKR